MCLSAFLATPARFRLPKKSLASIASWLVVAPLIALVSVTTSAATAQAVDCVVGSSADCPGASAKHIKDVTGTNTDGVYWITVGGVATQVYSIMNSAMDGGGWMLAMKGANTGATFNYNSTHWTTTSTLNTTYLRRNDSSYNEDAKFSVFNSTPASKVLAIFPDATAGGAITGQSYGFTWNETMPTPANTQSYSGRPTQGDYTGKTLRELFAGGEKIYIRDATNASPYRAAGSGVFSTQTDVRFFGFNYSGGSSSKARFGFGFNENTNGAAYPTADENSNDVEGGIGLNRSNTSAGDFIYCCQNSSGVNRQMKFELYVKAYSTVPDVLAPFSATPSDGQVTLNWGAGSATSPVTGYTVQSSSNGGSSWSTAVALDSTARSYTYSGLTNGTTYSFRANAVNALGAGAFATTTAIPSLPPDAPSINSLTVRQGAQCAANASPSTGVTAAMVGNDCVVQFVNVGTATWAPPAGVTNVQVLVVGGGGGGGFDIGGGGGGGAVVAGTFTAQASSYSVTVGGGGNGAGANLNGNLNNHQYTIGSSNGQDSVVTGTGLTLRAKGGGAGASSYYGYTPNYGAGLAGGNGGGSSGYSDGNAKSGGTQTQSTLGSTSGLTSVLSGSTGYNGGRGGGQYYSGGGAGAGAQGTDSTSRADGGAGFSSSITGTNFYWGGGGGGAGHSIAPGNGGAGGGGGGGGYGTGAGTGNTQGLNAGSNGQNRAHAPGGNGGVSTGGGGGGGAHYNTDSKGGNGGSGIVVLRYEAPSVYVEANLSAPAFNGGSAVTNYLYQYSTDGSTWSAATSSGSAATTFNLMGVTTGSYRYFRIAAKNPAGTSTYTQYPTSLLVAAAPTAPSTLVATRGNSQVGLTWTAPSAIGGANITDYVVEYSTNNSTWTVFADGTSTTAAATVTGLTNGTPYYFRVAAVNIAGTSAYLASSTTTTPATTPSAPQSLTVSSVVTETLTTNGLVGYWSFDGSSTLGVNSVAGNTALISGGSPAYTTSGKFGGGLLLNGSSYLSGSVLNLPTGSSSYSIGGWIRNTTLGTQGILGWGNWGTTNQTNALRTSNNSIYHYWWGNDVNPAMPSGQTLLNTWHHVIATYDGSTRKIYLDGALLSSAAASGLNAQNMNFRIGSTNNSENFIGTLDDIVVYNRALTLAEVGTVMNQTGGQVTLTWSDMANNSLNGGAAITNYSVDYSTDNTSWTNSAAGAATPTSATVTGLTSGASYYFRVRAINSVGNGAYATTGPRAIANPATLTYNGNSNTSGTVPSDATAYVVGQAVTVLGNTGNLSRTGYTFAGWTDNSSGTGTVYTAGNSYSLPSATSNLYAKWNGISNTVAYDAQGGAAVSSVTWVTGASLTLPAAPTRAGYTFNGWYDAENGGTRVGGASASYSPANTAGFTLYAQWTANTNTVAFDSRGGSSVDSRSWITATTLNLPPAPTRAGYTFNGWFAAASGGSPVAPMTTAANGLSFDGSGRVDVPHSNAFNFSTDITIEAWIKTTSNSEQYITTKNENSFYFGINLGGGAGKVSFWLNNVSSGSGGWLHSSATVNDGNWHHVAATYDGSTIKIYVDGILSASRSVSATIQTGSSSVNIGSRGGGFRFVGKMYDVRFWNVTRTASEISGAMNSQLSGSESGLVAHYSLNQGSDGGNNTSVTTATSSTGAHNGTLTGFTLTGSTSNWVFARNIVPTTSSYTPTNTSAFTLFAQWSANTNTITFDTLGGSAVATRTFQTGGSLALPATPTLAGSTFIGWFLATSGGSALPATYSPVATSDFTIYARWNTNRTLTINSSSYQAGYARTGTPPTLTATASAGVGTGSITFTSSTTSVCTVNATSGLVAFVTTGTCSISATITESGGFTSATSASVSLAIRATPGAPTGLAATPGNGQVTLSWVAPTNLGGGVTSYVVTATPGSTTCTWMSGPLSCSVTGLTNGTAYSFTVAAVNSQGSSAASSAVSATPRTVPAAPTITTVTQVGSSATRVLESTGLVLQYDANTAYAGTGTTLIDAKGNSNATIVNSPAYTSSGGGYFTMVGGSSQYMITNTSLHTRFSSQTNPSTTSIFMWVYPTASNGILLSEFGGASISSGWHDSQIEMVNGTMRFRVWNGANLGSSIATPLNNWYYVGFVYDQAAQTLKGYVNGSLAVTGTGYSRQTPWANGNTNLHFGIASADSTNLGSGAYGSFRFGSLHVYNTALAQAQVQQNYDAGCERFALCASLGVAVAFTAPTSTGGSTITGYTVTASNGATATGTTSPISVTGLSLGIPHTFTVTATNAAGTSVASAPSTSITLRGSPSAPTAPSASVANGGVALVWAAPSANGGTISDYTIQYSSNSGSTWTTYIDEVSPITASTVRGLTNGTSYIFRVAAISDQGTGSLSLASSSATPASFPEAPGKPAGSSDGTSITISWADAVNNGSTITNYIISHSSDSGNTWTTVARSASTATSATVSSLTAGLTYIFRVMAVNALGNSVNSAVSDPIAVGTAPQIPTTLVATIDSTTSTNAVLTWKKPTGGAGTVEAKPTLDATTFTQGLLGKRYVGYYNDNVNFFTTAPLFSGTGTPVNSTSIMNFSSNADFYSWMWTGYFKAPASGVYRFYLSSDDASHLWIGDNATTGYTVSNAVVNNGGLHPTITRTGSINLIANQMYPIRLMFGENWGGDIVSLFWDLPNGTRVTNGTGYFFQNPTGAVAAPVRGCAASVGNSGGVQISREGDNCVLKFTNPGVNTWTVPSGVTSADVLVVGGGGGAGFDAAGGGGGGAVVEQLAQPMIAGSTFSINVGSGGATSQSVGGQAQDGGTSNFGTISAVGGGGGGSKNANGRGVIGAGGGGGGHANPGSGGGITLGGVPTTGADSFWGWSASNPRMVNNQGSVAQFSYIQASLTRTIPLNPSVTSNVTFNVSVDNSINNIIGWRGERVDTYSIRVELLNSSGTVVAQNSFNGTTKHNLEARSVAVTYSGLVASVRITITGFDAGYWAGFYGPIFRNPSLQVNGAAFPPGGAVSGFGGGGASGTRRVGNGGGGGGAGGVGTNDSTSAGGVGVRSVITNTFFGGGGGGGSWNSTGGVGGQGGGGNGGNGSGASCGNDGSPNTGGGGGAMGNAGCSNRTLGAGGSGVVILRYAAASSNVELPPPSDYVIQYSVDSPISWQTFNDGVSPNETATVTGLEVGKKYIFRVASKNGVGTSSFTAASNMVEVRGASPAPTIASLVARNQGAVVNFTAPTSTGGSPITRYTATAVASGSPTLPNRTCTWNTGALTCTIGELTNGREYTVTLTATNAFGTSSASAGLTVTPKTTPDAPTALTATTGAAQLTLAWSAPVNTGGTPITGYKIERSTVAAPTWVVVTENTGNANTTATLTGLTNGTLYNIRVTALNVVGAGPVSEVTTGTPKGAPSAPNAPTGNGNNGGAFITWSAPTNNGAPITDYEIQYRAGSGSWISFVDEVTSATAATVSGLTNGTAYTFQVRAINSQGSGEWSAASASITPATVPDAPTLTAVTAPNPNQPGKLAITFTAGANGGSAITGYEFSINDGATWSPLLGTSNLSISDLTNGVSYSVRLRAVNAQGVSVASNSASGTPTAPADAPVISGVVAGDGSLTISFSAPANNGGSAVTGYKYQVQGSSGVWSASTPLASSPLSLTTLNNAELYSVRILSVNDGGALDGAWSTSVQGTPFTVPSAPTISTVTSGNGSLSLAYTVGSNGSPITATEYSIDGGTNWIRSGATTSPFVITGLVNGTGYTPRLRLVNAAGTGAEASGSTATPYTVPSAPAINSVTTTPTSITLNFTVNTGGSALTTISHRMRSVSASGITSCAASYGTLNWLDNWSTWTDIAPTSTLELTGLSSSNCYDIQIRAQNIAGFGLSSRESGKPVAPPSAPAILAITPGAATLAVTFSESTDNGGSAITAYEYRIGTGSWISLATLPGFTLGSSTLFSLGSLTNGTAYSITLRAVNSAGASAPSAAATETPVTTPGAPLITSVSPLDGALSVTFTAPTSTGGTAITGYQYRLNSGSWITLPASALLTNFSISGLVNGTPYQVALRALNARGNGEVNTFVTNVAPGTRPEAPSISAVIVGNEQIAVVIAPGLDGGYALQNYAYSINDGAWVTLTGAPSVALANPIVIPGLVNGTTYSFRVRTVNFIGESNASAPANGTPATVATAPSIVSISTNDGSLSVAFTAPTSNGGSAITSYDYSINGGTTWTRRTGTASPLVITGLTNGVAYNVKIRAINGISSGAESTALVGIPQIPGAGRPISLTTTPLNGSVRVAWSAPAAYVGAPIVGYRVNATPGTGSCLWTTGDLNCVVTGLTNGTSYTFTVTSLRDDNGTTRDIDTSVASSTTVPRTLPGAPTALTAVGGGNEAVLSWSAPGANGGAAITDYRVEYSSDAGVTWSAYDDAISAELTTTVGGLRPGTQYRFRVAAVNAAGVGAFSTESNSAKTFEQAPELTLTLDQQTADGYSFILSFQEPILYSIAATANNPSATVEQAGDYFTVRGLTPGASVTVTVTANRADYLQAIATIFSSALLASTAPSVSTAEALDGGFRVTVANYAANTATGISYTVTTTAGAVIDDGAGVYRIVGLANGESAIATVTSSRPGYVTRTTSVSGAALFLGVPAQVENIIGTRDGFTFTIANYSPEATYEFTSSKVGSTVVRVADLVTITGLANLEQATVTVKTIRTGYMDAAAEVIGLALPKSEVNTLSAISLSSGAVAFDPATFEYNVNVVNTVTTYRVTPTKSDIDSTMTISINGESATAIATGVQSAALPLNVGNNTIVIAVTSQVGAVQNYVVYVKRAKSTVSTLSGISLSAGSIGAFDPLYGAYEATVTFTNSSITITPTPSNSAATIRVKVNSGSFADVTAGTASGNLDLNVGNNNVVVEVTAEDGIATSTYEVTVTRSGASSSQLGALVINVGTMPTFNSATLNYEVIVPVGTLSARVTPTLASTTTGSISVNGVDLADGATSDEISLTAGATTAITILVSASDGSSSTPYVISVKVDAPPVGLTLARASSGTQSGVAFTVQPQVSVNDAQSNRVVLNTSNVSVAITSGAGGELTGTTTVAAVRGLVTFTNLGIRGIAGNTYTLTYSSGGLTVATQTITLTAGEAVALSFRTGSASTASGATIATPLQVVAVDGDGNTVTTFGSAIAIASSGNGAFTGLTTRTPIAGVATFSELAISGTAGTTYVITATSAGLTSATRNISVTFGAATTLALARSSVGPVSGVLFTTQPQIQIRDSFGNLITNSSAEVTVSIASGTGGTLGGGTTISAVNGVATFTDLSISGIAGTAYSFAYSATGLTSASETLTVTAGAPSRIQFVTSASGFNNGTAFRTQPVLRIQDASGNTVTTSSAAVTATISSGGVLLGTTTQSASSGVVTFTNLGVYGTPGAAYTITFAATGLTGATQTILLTSGSSLAPTFGTTTPTLDGFTVQITNFSRIFNWTFSLLEGAQSAQISLGASGFLTVTGMEVGSSATLAATTSRSGFENGAATITGSTLLAPLRPLFSATTSTATGFRAQVTNFDSSYTWRISASNGGTASISSTGLITVIDLNPGVSSDVTVTTSKTGRVSASATVTGTASGAETTTPSQDIAVNLLTAANVFPICAGGSSTNEGVANINDRNSKSKYLCFNSSSKLNASYIRNSAGFYTGDLGTKVVTGIQFTSGDSDRSRDPIIYTLFGCATLNGDCTPIVVNGRTGIDILRNNTGAVQSFLNTKAYKYYKVTFGALRTSWTDAAQVAEIALIGTDANAAGRVPTFGAVTRTANGFTVPITNWDNAFTWRASVDNSGGVAIGSDGLISVTGIAGGVTATVAVTTSRAKYENGNASISGVALNGALIPIFGTATPTSDGFTVPITNYSADYTWSATVATGAATITAGVLTVTGQTSAGQALVTVTTERATYATGRAQVVATALTTGLTPTFGPSISTTTGFTAQVRNYGADYTWNVSSNVGAATISSAGLITVTGLTPGASATLNVTTTRTGSFTVIAQTTGMALIGDGLTPRFALSISTADGFTAQILNYDAAYTWSGSAAAGQTVTISGTGLVTVTGVTTGLVATATINASRSGYSTGSNTISGTAVAPDIESLGGADIQLQVPVSATTSPTEVIVTIDIPVDAAPGSTAFTGSAVATDSVDQGLRTVKIGGTNSGTELTTVSTPIAVTIPASAGIGIPVYSPDGLTWLELPLLAGPTLPDGQDMGYFRYDDGTIVILTRKIGG